MQAIVINWFTDKETLIPHSEGKIIELSNERFAELKKKGFVDKAPVKIKKDEVLSK